MSTALRAVLEAGGQEQPIDPGWAARRGFRPREHFRPSGSCFAAPGSTREDGFTSLLISPPHRSDQEAFSMRGTAGTVFDESPRRVPTDRARVSCGCCVDPEDR